MTSSAKNRLAIRALIACVCAFAILIISLARGMRLSLAANSLPADFVVQISSDHGPAAPNKHCPFGNHAQDVGTCSSNNFVGIEHPAADQTARTELKIVRLRSWPTRPARKPLRFPSRTPAAILTALASELAIGIVSIVDIPGAFFNVYRGHALTRARARALRVHCNPGRTLGPQCLRAAHGRP